MAVRLEHRQLDRVQSQRARLRGVLGVRQRARESGGRPQVHQSGRRFFHTVPGRAQGGVGGPVCDIAQVWCHVRVPHDVLRLDRAEALRGAQLGEWGEPRVP